MLRQSVFAIRGEDFVQPRPPKYTYGDCTMSPASCDNSIGYYQRGVVNRQREMPRVIECIIVQTVEIDGERKEIEVDEDGVLLDPRIRDFMLAGRCKFVGQMKVVEKGYPVSRFTKPPPPPPPPPCRKVRESY